MPAVIDARGTRGALSELPGAEAETAEIATLLRAPRLLGRDASETAVRARLTAAPLVHLATHGFAYSREAQARASFVALAPDAVHDGLLTVGEILDDPRVRLTAELVVLSACQTGLGDLKQAGHDRAAAGILGQGRPKRARESVERVRRGDAAVDDRVLPALVRRCGPAEQSGGPAARAGGGAETPGMADPQFWAGFQLVGAS
jgi:CHAT domain-containing protein